MRKLTTSLVVAVALLLASIPVSRGSAQTATAGQVLQWKVSQGQKFDVNVVQEVDQQQNVGGQEVPANFHIQMKINWEVLEVEADGAFKVQHTVEDVTAKGKATSPFGEISFDSTSEEKPQGMGAMIAQQLQPTLSLRGMKLVERMAASGESLSVEFAEGQEAPKGPGGELTAENVKKMFSIATLKLPGDAIGEGASWSDELETEVPQLGEVTVTRKFTHKGQQPLNSKKVDLIEMVAKTDFGEAKANAMGMKIEVKDESTEGKLYFDSSAGYLVQAEMVQNVTATIDAMGQTIEQVQKITGTTTITPL